MKQEMNLALEIAKRHPISEEDAQNLLDGIDSGKTGNSEINYITALEGRDKVINRLIKEREKHLDSIRNLQDKARHLKRLYEDLVRDVEARLDARGKGDKWLH